MEVYNTVNTDHNINQNNVIQNNVIQNNVLHNNIIQNSINEVITTVDIDNIVDNVVEKIESGYETSYQEKSQEIKESSSNEEETINIIEIPIKKTKHSECTICTESVSDSSSEPESENYKCDTCSNHVHPTCMYNYGIYHNLTDLNSVPCYVCEKGILRPNNSIGRKIQAIAERLRGTLYNNTIVSENENNLEQHLLNVDSPRRIRREILERSGYFNQSQEDSEQYSDSEYDSELQQINADNINRQIQVINQTRNNNYYSTFIYNNAYCCLVIIRSICIFSSVLFIIVLISGFHTKFLL